MHREREQAAQKSLATQNRIATLLLSRSPFSASDLEALEKAAATCEYEILITPVARRHRSCHHTSSAPPVCSRQSLPWFSALHSLNSSRKDCRCAACGRRSRSKLGVSRRARKWNHIADIFETGEIHHHALQAEAEAGVGN